MFDQTFSPKNLKYIFDIENRKGKNLFSLINDPIINDLLERKEICSREKKILKRKCWESKCRDEKDNIIFNSKLEEIRSYNSKIDDELIRVLSEISKNISDKNFCIKFTPIIGTDGKIQYYENSNDIASLLALKKLQNDLKFLFNIEFGNRNNIIGQIRSILSFDLTKHVFRYDIRNFYESIDTTRIIDYLGKNRRLTKASISFIEKIFDFLKNDEHYSSGLPRGIGISAYLSEIFMEKFDSYISKLDGVIYYARYVDDILIITVKDVSEEFMNNEINVQLNNLGLFRSKEKYFYHKHDKNEEYDFDFLGYNFDWGQNKLTINLSKARLDRYKEKILRLLSIYRKISSQGREHLARIKLFKGLKFLTSNTRLIHNKSNVIIGIYNSNPYLTFPSSDLNELDDFVLSEFEKHNLLNNTGSKKRFKQISFSSGFDERRFIHLKNDDFIYYKKVFKGIKQ